MKFNINERYPSVEKLVVHLENGQRIYFSDTEQTYRIMANDPPQMTLMAFFKLCSKDDFAKTLLYAEVPSYFTWRDKKWNQRKKGIPVDSHIGYFKSDQLGRVYIRGVKLILVRGPRAARFGLGRAGPVGS